MFSGIVEGKAKIIDIKKNSNFYILNLSFEKPLENIKIGESFSINGVCLSVVDYKKNNITFEIMKETINKTNFKYFKKNEFVNWEESLTLQDRLNGHIVLGHIDGIGEIIKINNDNFSKKILIKTSKSILDLIVYKGSICVDGISLTVSKKTKSYFEISLIPLTLKITTMNDKKVGDKVNLENDYIGKYIFNFLKK